MVPMMAEVWSPPRTSGMPRSLRYPTSLSPTIPNDPTTTTTGMTLVDTPCNLRICCARGAYLVRFLSSFADTFLSEATAKSTTSQILLALSMTTTSGRLLSTCCILSTGLSRQISMLPSSLCLTSSGTSPYHRFAHLTPLFLHNS